VVLPLPKSRRAGWPAGLPPAADSAVTGLVLLPDQLLLLGVYADTWLLPVAAGLLLAGAAVALAAGPVHMQ